MAPRGLETRLPARSRPRGAHLAGGWHQRWLLVLSRGSGPEFIHGLIHYFLIVQSGVAPSAPPDSTVDC